MEDHYGRTIDYMRISITDRCNLRCRYCMPDGISLASASDILTYEEIELICQAAVEAGIRKFKVTGGEPLVRSGCAGLVGRLKKIPGISQVTLTTNGVLLGKYLRELLDNGLDAVNVSLDTLRPEVYQAITGQDELAKALESIRQAIGSGIHVKINSVLQKEINEKEWEGLAELTRKLPLDVRFIEMMPIGCGKGYETVYNEEILDKLQQKYPGISRDGRIHGNGPAVYYRIPGAKGSIGFISAMHGKFCGTCNRIRLTAQGRLKPCLCFGKSIDLSKILRAGGKSGRRDVQEDEEVRIRVKEALALAVREKPKSHRFEEEKEITEFGKMVQIGG